MPGLKLVNGLLELYIVVLIEHRHSLTEQDMDEGENLTLEFIQNYCMTRSLMLK